MTDHSFLCLCVRQVRMLSARALLGLSLDAAIAQILEKMRVSQLLTEVPSPPHRDTYLALCGLAAKTDEIIGGREAQLIIEVPAPSATAVPSRSTALVMVPHN